MPQNTPFLALICLIVAVFAAADVLRERLPASFWTLLAADAQWRLTQVLAERSLRPIWRKRSKPA